MLTRDELSQLTTDERARYDRAMDFDKPHVERSLRENLRQREDKRRWQADALFRDPMFDAPPQPLPPPRVPAYPVEPSRYRMARFVIAVEDVIGALLLIGGCAWLAWSSYRVVTTLQEISRYNGSIDAGAVFGLLSIGSFGPALGLIILAIIVFAHGQMLRATLDTADSTRELLAVTKQALARNGGR